MIFLKQMLSVLGLLQLYLWNQSSALMLAIKSFLVDKFLTVWWAVVIVLLALPFGVWLANYSAAASAETTACYVSNDHQICLESLRRSAQRY
ncbi:MAG: hypothetical protein WA947_20160, partial [Phormidesmis sp.]